MYMELIHEKFGTIRFEQADDGAPLFCAADVCRVLGYKNDTDAIQKHCRERGVAKRYLGVVTGKKSDGTDAVQQVQMTFIDEGNLYRLILRSNMPQARAFEDWVCDEVLPGLRRTGKYEIPKRTNRQIEKDEAKAYKQLIEEIKKHVDMADTKLIAKKLQIDRRHVFDVWNGSYKNATILMAIFEYALRKKQQKNMLQSMKGIEAAMRMLNGENYKTVNQ
jgi:prophage antirepressor-like protein